MRIWDIDPSLLCREHLLGEHRELHALWTILTENKKGYRKHPETLRWVGKLPALYNRHSALVSEMENRGYQHNSPLDKTNVTGDTQQHFQLLTITEQKKLLRNKGCTCKV